MASDRQRAQRRLAKQLRSGYQRQFEPQTRTARQTHESYLNHLLTHPEDITPEDEKMLARRASWAQWEQKKPGSHPGADSRWLTWDEFFYHGSAGDNVGYGEG